MVEWDNNVPLKEHPFHQIGENTVSQWAFKLNSALATAETWDLKDHMLKVKGPIMNVCVCITSLIGIK